MSYIAIDVGSGLVKFSNSDGRSLFPSLVGKIKPADSFKLGLDDHQSIKVKDTHWMTGLAAQSYIDENSRIQATKSSWSETDGHLILLYSAISFLYPQGFKGIMRIVTGLPMKKYLKEVGNYTNKLIGIHKFSTPVHEYEVEFTEESTVVIPQVIGLHFSNMLKNEKGPNWQELKIGYIDPGTQTTGWAVMDDGIFQNLLSDGEDVGLIKLALEIKKYLKSKYDFTPTDNVVVLKALTKGYIDIWENNVQIRIDLVEVSQQFVPEVYKDVLNKILKMWNKAQDMHVVLSSGGGKYLINTVQKHIPHAVLLNKPLKIKKGSVDNSNEAIYDVTEGYAVYAESANA